MTGAVPFSGLTDQAVCSQVLLKNAHPARPLEQDKFKSPGGDTLWSLITQSWDADSRSRPTAAVVREKVSRFLVRFDYWEIAWIIVYDLASKHSTRV